MEGERSSQTVTTTQLSHWQETWSIPHSLDFIKPHIHFHYKVHVRDSEFMGESVHGMGIYGSRKHVLFFRAVLLQLLMCLFIWTPATAPD